MLGKGTQLMSRNREGAQYVADTGAETPPIPTPTPTPGTHLIAMFAATSLKPRYVSAGSGFTCLDICGWKRASAQRRRVVGRRGSHLSTA